MTVTIFPYLIQKKNPTEIVILTSLKSARGLVLLLLIIIGFSFAGPFYPHKAQNSKVASVYCPLFL